MTDPKPPAFEAREHRCDATTQVIYERERAEAAEAKLAEVERDRDEARGDAEREYGLRRLREYGLCRLAEAKAERYREALTLMVSAIDQRGPQNRIQANALRQGRAALALDGPEESK